MKTGFKREDGKIFWGKTQKNRKTYLTWISQDSYLKYKESQSIRHLFRSKLDPIYVSKRRQNAFKWKNKNKELASAYRSSRRSLLKTGKMTDSEKSSIKLIYGFRDILNKVHSATMFHVDHKIPLSKGGKHEASNLQVVTAGFNLRKSSRINCS